MKQFIFTFNVEGAEGTITIHDWDWIENPVVGDSIYLHDFLEKDNGNVLLINDSSGVMHKGINTILVNYKFKITERIFISASEKMKKIEYTVEAVRL